MIPMRENKQGWLLAWAIMLALGGVTRGATAGDGASSVSSVPSEASAAEKPFSIQRQDGNFGLVRPNGERFFSLGVCVVNMGASRAEFDLNNPRLCGLAALR